MSWKQKMSEQRELKVEGSKLLHKRVALLIEIENDASFLAWCADQGLNPVDELDDELAEIGHGFLVLKTVMEQFPSECDWGKRLSHLIADVRERQRRPKPETERMSWKQIAEQRQKEIEALQQQVAELQARLEELRQFAAG